MFGLFGGGGNNNNDDDYDDRIDQLVGRVCELEDSNDDSASLFDYIFSSLSDIQGFLGFSDDSDALYLDDEEEIY